MTDRELMEQASEIEMLAKRFSEGWHEGIKIDALDIELLLDVAAVLRERLAQPEPNARAHHKMMIAMTKEHWRSIDPQWKDDPELCHALGYEAGYKDAVARRVEPRSGESGAGFESLPASSSTWWDDPVPQMRREWQGLTEEEMAALWENRGWYVRMFKEVEAKLKEKNA